MRFAPLSSLIAATIAAGALSLSTSAAAAMSDGMGGFYTDDGDHYASDGMGGYYDPDGDRMMSDGGGGYYTDYGHIMPDGNGGYRSN